MQNDAAESAFVEFVRLGPGADFDAFCAGRPAEAPRLRALLAEHERALARMRAAGATAIPVEVAPSSSVLKSASPASGELLRRILAQGSKGARYQPRGEVARGGMGVVMRVWDDDLGRELAMKVVIPDVRAGDDDAERVEGRRVSRFLEEAQITGQLDHPCVVPVHELGLGADGQVYFTMRLVKGRDFGHVLGLVANGAEGWTRTRALGVLLRVCEAMAYAHSKGVVHRDLKPANVMVGKFGEVYVMDWGLARVLGREDAHDMRLRDPTTTSGVRTYRSGSQSWGDMAFVTMDGDVVGTPAYMPPEQARGRIEEIEARSDVYAIGAMLYHVLAGEMPYVAHGESKSNVEVLNAVLEGPPRPLRALRDDVPAELEAVCEKAMARDPAARYADTLALAEDLRAFLEGRVVQAYETGAIVELKKWVARNKALATAAAAAIVFLVAGLVGSLWQKSVADRNAVLAAEKAQEAERKGELAAASSALAETRAGEAAASAARAGAVRDFLTDMLASANPFSGLERDMPVSRLVDQAAERLDAGGFASDPASEIALRSTLGEAYQGISRFAEAERQYRAALALSVGSPSADPFGDVEMQIDLAEVLASRAQHVEARELAESVLADLARRDASHSGLAVRALLLRASCTYNAGDRVGAIAAAREAVELRGELDGADSESTAATREKLAFYLVQGHRLDEAVQEAERAIAVLENGSQRARILSASALRTRAAVHLERRHMKDAIADLDRALAIRRDTFGEESAFVADLYEDLATAQRLSGDPQTAETYTRRALELRRRFLGEHRDTATSLASLANALRMRKAFAEARSLYEEALEMRRRVFGPDSSPVGDSLRRLAKLSADEGDLATAERLLLESTANWEKSIGPDGLDLADNCIELAAIMSATGRGAEARAQCERAVALRTQHLGPTAARTNEARDTLASLLLSLRDWRAAETFLRESIATFEELKKSGAMLSYMRAQLGAALVGQARYDEAEPLLLDGWTAIGDNPQMWAVNKLFILDHLIALYDARGDADSATRYRERAEALRR